MSNVQDTITDIAKGLHKADLISQTTLRELVDDDLPDLIEFTGEDIQHLRQRQKISQSVFAKYLNISPATVRSLEQGKRHAHGAILKLLNIVNRHGIKGLI